jgi:hypothetical protein
VFCCISSCCSKQERGNSCERTPTAREYQSYRNIGPGGAISGGGYSGS